MAMIAFAALVVVSQDAYAINDQSKTVLVVVRTIWYGLRHHPDTLLDGNIAKHKLFISDAVCFHYIAL
jgi:hypothetical protein